MKYLPIFGTIDHKTGKVSINYAEVDNTAFHEEIKPLATAIAKLMIEQARIPAIIERERMV